MFKWYIPISILVFTISSMPLSVMAAKNRAAQMDETKKFTSKSTSDMKYDHVKKKQEFQQAKDSLNVTPKETGSSGTMAKKVKPQKPSPQQQVKPQTTQATHKKSQQQDLTGLAKPKTGSEPASNQGSQGSSGWDYGF